MNGNSSNPNQSCVGCELAQASRRAFLRNVGLAVVGAVALGGVSSPASALARAVFETAPARRDGSRHAYDIPPADSVAVDVDNDVVLARWEERVYAFSIRCPHRGARLEWHADEQRIFCPKHKARFNADGSHASGRRSRDLDRYPLTREGNSVVVDVSAVLHQDTDAAAWARAVLLVG